MMGISLAVTYGDGVEEFNEKLDKIISVCMSVWFNLTNDKKQEPGFLVARALG